MVYTFSHSHLELRICLELLAQRKPFDGLPYPILTNPNGGASEQRLHSALLVLATLGLAAGANTRGQIWEWRNVEHIT